MSHLIRLREKDIYKLSEITNCPPETLQQMSEMNLLDVSEVRNKLILNDWRKLKRSKTYKSFQIIEAIATEYQVSSSKVEFVIYAKKRLLHYCEKCGKRISKVESIRNSGICDGCTVKSIRL